MQRRLILPGQGKFIKAGRRNAAHSILLTGQANSYLTISDSNWGNYNRQKWALSFWIRRLRTGSTGTILAKGSGATADTEFQIGFTSGDKFTALSVKAAGPATDGNIVTTATYTSLTNWYHFLFHYDSANGTAGDRMKLWVDGSEVTTFDTDTNPSSTIHTVSSSVQLGHINSGTDILPAALLHQVAFFSGTLPAVTDLRNSGTGKPINPMGQAGLWSLTAGAAPVAAYDSAKGLNWTGGSDIIDATIRP